MALGVTVVDIGPGISWTRSTFGSLDAVVLANHGPAVAGTSLAIAQYAIEELEETAKLSAMLKNQALRLLMPEQIAGLRCRFAQS